MKIQYKSKSLLMPSENRYLLYRIEPSELSWWARIFKNSWRYVYKSYTYITRYDNEINDCLCFLFTANEAHDIVEKYDTYEKLIDFLTVEYDKALEMYHKAQEEYKKENTWKI